MKTPLVALLLATLPSHAAPLSTESLRDEISTRLAIPLLKNKAAVGLVVGVVRGDESLLMGFGEIRKGSGVVPTAETRFPIPSITKTFTALALARQAETESGFSLEAPLRELAPFPLSRGLGARPLRSILDQSSGLPTLPDDFRPANERDPYADYTLERMKAFVARVELEAPAYRYSNLGYGLAGLVGSSRRRETYGAWLKRLVLDPLGLPNTGVQTEIGPARATGHDRDQNVTTDWQLPEGFEGTGTVFSTGQDLLSFLKAQLRPQGPLASAIRLSRKPSFTAEPPLSLGLAWHLFRLPPAEDPIVFHNGMLGGFTSAMAFDPGRDRGVFVLSNQSPLYAKDGSPPSPEAMDTLDLVALELLGRL